jgi:hypothetical protein
MSDLDQKLEVYLLRSSTLHGSNRSSPSSSLFQEHQMRSEFPRIQELRDESAGAFLSYLTTRIDRDIGGNVYRFIVDRPGLTAEVEVTVDRMAVIGAAAEARAGGADYDKWSFEQRREYIEQYTDKNGQWFTVKSFKGADIPEDIIIVLRDCFIDLFFQYASSYRYNTKDYNRGKEGYYADTIEFRPYELDHKYYMIARAEDSHD